jgi:hypothetical protein
MWRFGLDSAGSEYDQVADYNEESASVKELEYC